MSEMEKLIRIYQQLEDAGLMVIAGKKDSAELMVSHDVVPVVRCKDCKHSYDGVANLMCGRCGQHINGIRLGGVSVKEEHFCSYGERRTDERKTD